MIFRIATRAGKLLLTRDAGKAKKAILEGGKKASKRFIERIKNKKAAERSARYYKHEMKMLENPSYFHKAMKPEFAARRMESSMGLNPRVAGRTNPKSKTRIKGMPVQKKFKGGLLVKPKLAIGGY
jgi:hypothetical protein